MRMARSKVIIWSIALASICFAVVLFGPYIRDGSANDQHLRIIEQALQAIPTPPNTKRLASHSAVGLLIGGGNHCDFFAGELFRSEQTPDSIRGYYSNRLFLNPITGTNEEISVVILTNAAHLNLLLLPYEFERPETWGISTQSFDSATVFLVRIMRSYRANRDMRCH